MSGSTTTLSFRPFGADDIAMVISWVTSPRTAQWFDDPNYDEELYDHLSDDRVDQWVVLLDGAPLAYLQDYRIHGWENHPLGFLPTGSRGMDTCIGTETDMAHGLGPAYLRLHADRLFASGVPALGIDPHPENTAAIRAYEKVGFAGETEVTSKWGRMRLMTLWPT